MKLCLIYLATGLINDKRYIGQTRYNRQTPRIEQRKAVKNIGDCLIRGDSKAYNYIRRYKNDNNKS